MQIIVIWNFSAKFKLSSLLDPDVFGIRKLYYKTNKQLDGKVSLARFVRKIFNIVPCGHLALPRSTDQGMNVLKCAEQWKN